MKPTGAGALLLFACSLSCIRRGWCQNATLSLQTTDPYHRSSSGHGPVVPAQEGEISDDKQLADSLALLLATAMEINDTRSIIRMLPQQTVVTLPADPDLPASSTEGQQQLPQSQPSQVRNASTTAQLMQKLGAALPAAVSSTQPGAVLPIQGALPYGNTTAGGAFSQPATGQPGALVQSQTAEAAASANASTAGTLSSAAGRLLPAQAWQGYPEHNPSAHNTTGTDLYTSTGAAGQQQEAGVDLTRAELVRLPLPKPAVAKATSLAQAPAPGQPAVRGPGLILKKDTKARSREGEGLAGCKRDRNAPCKFFILDMSEIAVELGFPSCSVDRFVADPESGITLPNPALVPNFTRAQAPEGHDWIYPFTTQPHYQSQNAGPWYVYHTLKNSVNTVPTISQADAIYVYDYCYVMWALGDHHARGHWWLKDNYNPERKAGHYLLSAYRAVMGLPRWKRTGGRDFVFYHSHPGFEWDDLDVTTAYQETICNDFQWATMLAVEQGQRWRCRAYSPRSTVIVPYSSTESINSLPLKEGHEKETLLYFRGRCDTELLGNMGKLMRSVVVRNLREALPRGDQGPAEKAAPEINVCCHGQDAGDEVRCTDREFEQNRFATQQHRSLMQQMANSAFCLIMPGNSQSSQRLTEAFLTGCIPVFIGPPWHSLPLTQKVDYASAALFLNISMHVSGSSESPVAWWQYPELKMKAGLDPHTQDVDRYSPAWWYADVPETAIIPLRKLEAVLPYLRQMPDAWMEQKRQAVMKYRNLFIYTTAPQNEASASDALIDLMCSYARVGAFQGDS
ncbi:g13167 [Coccomyxa viridis]|uniref:G13167 protein n=1 Tax=Coccomyxa viridis TaxID=1274662 RepID=A0ABP1GHN1_9CHLO